MVVFLSVYSSEKRSSSSPCAHREQHEPYADASSLHRVWIAGAAPGAGVGGARVFARR